MNLKCLVVDDEPLARNLLTDYVSKVPYLSLTKACSNAMEAMQELKKSSVDILFLDVQMPEVTGTMLLKTLQKKPLVVLTTAYSQYALEGYELDVADYLLKPITFERFLKSVDKLSQRITSTQNTSVIVEKPADKESPEYIFVKDGTKLVKVRCKDILYVEGLKDYVTIYTSDQKVTSLQRMKSLSEQLPAHKFIRIHNSYIVALDAIDAIHKDKVVVEGNHLPIGDTYKKTFMDFIEGKRI